jgi:hypothetical protein
MMATSIGAGNRQAWPVPANGRSTIMTEFQFWSRWRGGYRARRDKGARADTYGYHAQALAPIHSEHSDDAHQFSAQNRLGGVLGGNLANYTMITSKTCLQVRLQSIKRKRR